MAHCRSFAAWNQDHDRRGWGIAAGAADALAVEVHPGERVGHHSVIGACSFVNRDIPPYTVAVGVPCRPVGRVEVGEEGMVNLVYDRA